MRRTGGEAWSTGTLPHRAVNRVVLVYFVFGDLTFDFIEQEQNDVLRWRPFHLIGDLSAISARVCGGLAHPYPPPIQNIP